MRRLFEIGRCLWLRMRGAWAVLLTKLNAMGALALLYVSQQPGAPEALYSLFPEGVRPLARVVVPLLWFWLVQHATKRAVTHGK